MPGSRHVSPPEVHKDVHGFHAQDHHNVPRTRRTKGPSQLLQPAAATADETSAAPADLPASTPPPAQPPLGNATRLACWSGPDSVNPVLLLLPTDQHKHCVELVHPHQLL